MSFLVKTGEEYRSQGPFSGAQLKQLAATGQLQSTFLVSQDDGVSWHQASRFAGLEFSEPVPDQPSDDSADVAAIPEDFSEPADSVEPVEATAVDQAPLMFPDSHWKKSFAFSPSGDCLAIGSQGVVTLWDIRSQGVQLVIRGKRGAEVESLVFSADGRQIVACFEDDYKARVFDAETGNRVQLLDGDGNGMNVRGVIGDHSLITTNGWCGTVDRWDLESGEKVATLVAYAGTTEEVEFLAVTPDDGFVVTSREDDEDLRIFSLETKQRIGVCWGHESTVKAVAASPLSNVVASGDEDGTVVLWDIPSGETIRKADTGLGGVGDLAFSPCGTRLLVTGRTECVLVLDVDDLSTIRRLELEQDSDHLVLSSDGNLLACEGTSDGVVVWNLGSPHESLEEMVRVPGSETTDGEFDADDESDGEEVDSWDDDENGEERWDEDDDPIDGEEEIEGVFDPEGWSLATEGEIEWAQLIEAVGTAREASLLTQEAWQSAQAENRVLTICHDGDGMAYVGRVGLHRGNNYCRVVVNQSMPDGVRINQVDIRQIDRDFDQATMAATDASEELLRACSAGDVEAARQALANGADVTYHDYETELTPLKAAISSGSVEIVQVLLDGGLGPDSGSGGWRTAISSGRPEIAGVLAENGFEQEPDEALVEACRLGQSAAVTDILGLVEDIDASVTVWDDRGVIEGTPLTVAAAFGHLEVVRQLIDAGANPQSADSKNITPWAAAASGGHQQVCDVLESHEAQTDAVLALVVAAYRGQLEVIESLIEQGVDANATALFDSSRITPIQASVVSENIEVDSEVDDKSEAEEATRVCVVEKLLEHGADPNTVDDDGNPLLHTLVRNGREVCVRILAEAGAELEATDSEGRTALIVAVARNDESQVGRLLFRGANPNVSDEDGLPALLQMFDEYSQCNETMAKWLIAYGVALDATDSQGQVLEQLCQKILRKGAEEDEYSYESAQALIELLHDTDRLEQVHGLLTRADAVFREQLDCALEFLESTDLAFSLIKNRLAQVPDQVVGLLEELFEDEDWSVRHVAAQALGEAGLAAADVMPLMMARLADPDEDVREAIRLGIVALGQEAVEPLLNGLPDCPIELLQTMRQLVLAIDSDRDLEIRSALENLLPDDIEAVRGEDRLRSGIVLGMLGAIHEGIDEIAAAMSFYEQSVSLHPDFQIGFWGELAALKSSQGDDALEQALERYNGSFQASNFSEYREQLESCMEMAPEFPWSANNLAWAFAAHSDASFRDGERAVELATRLCERDQWQFHSFLDTLAAAFAEVGNFEKAVEHGQLAIEAGPESSQGEYRDNLEQYQQGSSLETTPQISGVVCPACEWKPTESAMWPCDCGHFWNMFETRGECPDCGQDFDSTECQSCGEWSPHETWYE